MKDEDYIFIFEIKQKEFRLRNGAAEVLRQEKVVGGKFCLYGEKWYWVKVLWGEGGRGLLGWDGEIVLDPPEIKTNDVQ